MSYKVAVYGPGDWALGSINMFIKKHLQNAGYNVRLVDWRNAKDIIDAFEWCDVFITEVHMYERWFRHQTRDIQEKGMYVWHHLSEIPGFSLEEKPFGHFATKIPVDKSLINNYFAITKKTKESADSFYGLDVGILPVGTDDDFWDKRKEFGPIKRIGCVMSPENKMRQYNTVKRYWVFAEIGEKAGVDYDYCFGKRPITGSYIYKDFDLIVNTSTHEGLPTPLLECSAAKVPFISTRVGIVPEYSSIKTFETVDEAVEIIKELNSDPSVLKKYVEDVYEEVAMSNLWEDHVRNYYAPAIDKIVESKMPDVSKELVVSHFNDSLKWLDNIKKTDVTVYTKSDKPPKRSAIRMKNEGMIEHTIYSHLANRYDSLSDYTIFCQDNPFDHVSDFIDHVNYFDPSEKNNALLHKGGYWGWHDAESLRENDWDGYPDYNRDWSYITSSGTIPRPHRVLKVDEVWNELFETEMPDKLMFCPAAHFCVSRDQVRTRSKRFYEKVAEMCKEREWGPWEIERVTWAIFDEDIVAKF